MPDSKIIVFVKKDFKDFDHSGFRIGYSEST